jgi:hypothetical protein
VKYRAFYQNGGFATFEWEGDPTDVEQLDDLLEAAYQAAPTGLCHQCARNYDISDDAEVYEISEEESDKKVFSEPTWDDRIRESAANATKLNKKLVAELEEIKAERNRLHRFLVDAGFTVDLDTYAVSR